MGGLEHWAHRHRCADGFVRREVVDPCADVCGAGSAGRPGAPGRSPATHGNAGLSRGRLEAVGIAPHRRDITYLPSRLPTAPAASELINFWTCAFRLSTVDC